MDDATAAVAIGGAFDATTPAVELSGTPRAALDAATEHAAAAPLALRGSRWSAARTAMLVVSDLIALSIGYIAARNLHPERWDSILMHPISASIFATVAVWPVIFAAYGLYDTRRATHVSALLQRLVHAVAFCVLAVVLLTFFARIEVSRSFIGLLFVLCLATTVTGRLLVRRILHALNTHAVTVQRALVVGVNEEGRSLARTLRRRRWMGMQVLGFIEVSAAAAPVLDETPVLGNVDAIAQVVAEHRIDTVIIAGSAIGSRHLQRLDALLPRNVTVRVTPGLPNLGAARVMLEPIDGMALFSVRRRTFSRRQLFMKRAFDIAVSLIALIPLAPVLALIALLVKLDTPGPVFFRQQRVGIEGKPFTMLKFRTMVADAEARRTELVEVNEADGLLFKMRRDPRVTRTGRWLRRFSLDELPQIINVLDGSMSLVGPRPALPHETERYDTRWRARLRVKPGLTGLWQVNGRHDLVFEDYIRYDLFYVENWSLTLDLYIIAKTVPALLTARGSY